MKRIPLDRKIPLGEDSIGPKHRYWCAMTTRSCNFDKSQYRQLRMGYDFEIGQQLQFLEKSSLGTSCQLLVTQLLRRHALLINRNNSSHGWATIIKFGQLQKLYLMYNFSDHSPSIIGLMKNVESYETA